MTSNYFKWNRLHFQDISGNLREIRGCPLTQLARLDDLLKLFHKLIEESQEESQGEAVDFRALWLNNLMFRQVCSECLKLCGIEPDWCDVSMLIQLLHHYEDEDAEGNQVLHPGLLVELNFPPPKRPTRVITSIDQSVSQTISLMVTLGLANNLEQALYIASEVSGTQLQQIIEARLEQLNPKAAEEDKTMEELGAKIQEMWGSGGVLPPPPSVPK